MGAGLKREEKGTSRREGVRKRGGEDLLKKFSETGALGVSL